MKIASRLLAGTLVALGTFTASAAPITWGPVTTITSASSLDQTGTLVTAINAGGNQGAQVVSGTDITFNDGGITASLNGGTVSNSGNGGWYSPTTGNAGLDVVLDSHSYISGGNPNGRGQIDITGLTPGVKYRLQVIGVADDARLLRRSDSNRGRRQRRCERKFTAGAREHGHWHLHGG